MTSSEEVNGISSGPAADDEVLIGMGAADEPPETASSVDVAEAIPEEQSDPVSVT